MTSADIQIDPNWREVLSDAIQSDALIQEVDYQHPGKQSELKLHGHETAGVDDEVGMRLFFAPREEMQGQSLEQLHQDTHVTSSIQELSSTSQFKCPSSMPMSFGPAGQQVSQLASSQEHATDVGNEDPSMAPKQTCCDTTGHSESEEQKTVELEQAQLGEDLSNKVRSDEEVVNFLTNLQLVLAVPTVDEIRRARPLRKAPDEIYVAQFVLQAARRKAQDFFGSEKGIREYHPHMEDGVFGHLDDGSKVIYQTNGIARVEEKLLSRQVKCDKSGAPGVYLETRMWVSRMREGKGRSGLKGAQTMTTKEQFTANRFYSFISSQLWFACTGTVGELGEEDTGERVFIRRAARDFKQYWSHDFPIAKQLCLLIDHENSIMMRKFLYDPGNTDSLALVQYECSTIRAWQTYEKDGKPPKDDAAQLLITAARHGRTAELERLVLRKGLDANTILSEFGLFGAGGAAMTTFFTRNELAYAIEGTALIEAIRLGWLSVVECIINFASQGLANLDVVCSEWNPKGTGGPGLRQHYTALDIARLYHRKDIEALLVRANAKSWAECPRHKRENPFDVRANQESGQQQNEGSERHEEDFDDFSFANFDGIQMDDEMKGVIVNLEKEIKSVGESPDREKFFRKLALRWHPDKHPDEKKALATRVFQWIQYFKDTVAWEGKAWSA